MRIGAAASGRAARCALALLLASSLATSCQLLLSEPDRSYCGDNVVQADSWRKEECDEGADNGSARGIVGHAAGGAPQYCSKTCKLQWCGDGDIDKELGEQCDDGAGNDLGGKCLPFNNGSGCKKATCGDRQLWVRGTTDPEVCDDGNTKNGDGCSSDCSFRGRVTVIRGTNEGGLGVANGVGSQVRFAEITALASDEQSSELYIADAGAAQIRQLSLLTGVTKTIAGSQRTKVRGTQYPTSGSVDGDRAGFLDDQPKRLALFNDGLWIGEADELRRVALTAPHEVRTCLTFKAPSSSTQLQVIAMVAATTRACKQSTPARFLYVAVYTPPSTSGTPDHTTIYRIAKECSCDGHRCELERLTRSPLPGFVRLSAGRNAGELLIFHDQQLKSLDACSGQTKRLAGQGGRVAHLDGPITKATFDNVLGIAPAAPSDGGAYVLERNALQWANVRYFGDVDGVTKVVTIAGLSGNLPVGRASEADGFGSVARLAYYSSIVRVGGLLYLGGSAAVRAISTESPHQVATQAGVLLRDLTYRQTQSITAFKGTLYLERRGASLEAISLRGGPTRQLKSCHAAAGGASYQIRGVQGLAIGRTKASKDGKLSTYELYALVHVAPDDKQAAPRRGVQLCRFDLDADTGTPNTKGLLLPTPKSLADDRNVFGLTYDPYENGLFFLSELSQTRDRRPQIHFYTPKDGTTRVLHPTISLRRPSDLLLFDPCRDQQATSCKQTRFLYVSDSAANRVLRIDPTPKKRNATVALGGGTAATVDGDWQSKAQFCRPLGLATDGTSIFVGEGFCREDDALPYGNGVRQINPASKRVSTLVGPGPHAYLIEGVGQQAALGYPRSMAYDATTKALYAIDLWQAAVVKID